MDDRLRIVQVTRQMALAALQCGISGVFELPSDTYVRDFYEDREARTVNVIIRSAEFSPVNEGDRIPTIIVPIREVKHGE